MNRLAKRASIALCACLLAGLTVSAGAEPPAQIVDTISSKQFASKRSGEILVDVREPGEWAATGLPTDGIGISVSRIDFVAAVLQAAGGNKSQPVAVICRSGARSSKAAQLLADAGFTHVTNIGDGMMGNETVGEGWQAAGLPTAACKVC
ncbi:MAG: rhodanese-like domain-containing protein [Hyphomonadaceae bacterium]